MLSFFRGCWEWKSQVFHLAKIDLVKTCRGAVLGWIWLFVRPATYVFVFWLALALGLKAGSTVGDYPYIVWLTAGLIPWFFMQELISTGSDVYRRYTYLVNKIKFPLVAISAFYALSKLYIYLMSMGIFMLGCIIFGYHFSIYLIQLPFVFALMYGFFVAWSVMTSPLSAISKDFGNLIKTLSTPLFWLSGIIFNLGTIHHEWVHTVMCFNPVSFFVEAHRYAMCDNMWLWENPKMLLIFLVVFLATIIVARIVFRRLNTEVADVL